MNEEGELVHAGRRHDDDGLRERLLDEGDVRIDVRLDLDELSVGLLHEDDGGTRTAGGRGGLGVLAAIVSCNYGISPILRKEKIKNASN